MSPFTPSLCSLPRPCAQVIEPEIADRTRGLRFFQLDLFHACQLDGCDQTGNHSNRGNTYNVLKNTSIFQKIIALAALTALAADDQ